MKTLLWIDDDEDLIESAIPVFEKNGFRIIKATTVSRALTVLRDDRLDGVLLDVRLSGGESGLELLDELLHRHSGLTVAVFTGYPDYADHFIAEHKGAAAYFAKLDKSIPLDPDMQRGFFSALQQIFAEQRTQGAKSARRSGNRTADSQLWTQGLFFLLLFTVVLVGVGALSRAVPGWLFPVAVIAAAILYVLVAVFVLAQQGKGKLEQKNLIKLVLESFRRLPLLRGQRARGVK